MSKLLREPLLHFLLLGAALFLLHGWIGSSPGGDGERIVITQGRVTQLATGFARMHQRAPDVIELDGLVNDAIREEIYYREAKALGLDEDDTIVRRRLRQKLEFVSEDIVPVPEPDDAQLQAYLQAHPEKFRAEARYTLTQVYLDPLQHGPRLAGDTQALLAQLHRVDAVADASRFGDALMREHRFRDVPASELARLFGARFEVALRALPTDQWAGPVPSGYGVHLVYLDERVSDRAAPFDLVRDEVRRAWIHDERQKANERFYADLRQRYEVTVENPTAKVSTSTVSMGMQ